MALQKQNVSFNFSQGIDTKSDPKQVIAGKLLELENGTFISPTRIKKRHGNEVLSNVISEGTTISNGMSLPTFKDELIETDGTTLYSYAVESEKWTNKGGIVALSVDAMPVVRNNRQQSSQDSCFHPFGVQCFVYEDSGGGSRYTVMDYTTGQQIVSNEVISATAIIPKCYAIGNLMIIIYFDTISLTIKYRVIPAIDPQTIGSATDLITDSATVPVYDAQIIHGNLYITYNNNTAGISVAYVTPLLQPPVILTLAGDTAQSISLFSDPSFNVWVIYYNGTSVKVFIRQEDLSLILAPTIIETISNIGKVTGSYDGTQGRLYYEKIQTNVYDYFVKTNTMTVTGTVGTPVVVRRSVGLASKSFLYAGHVYFVATHDSALQPTYFLMNEVGFTSAKISPQVGGGIGVRKLVPNVNLVSTGVYQISFLQKDFVTALDGQVYFQLGVMESVLDFNQAGIAKAELANNLHLTGGFLTMYDGAHVVEHGFHLYPENATDTVQTIGGGLSPKQYQYAITYEWTDNYGQIHRSNPSSPTTINLNPDTSQTGFNFTANTTNTDPTITNVSSLSGITIGALITGPGIPVNTTVVAIVSATSIRLSNPASATATSQIMTLHPFFTFPASTQNGSTTMTAGFIQYLNLVGTWDSSSTTMTVSNATGLSGYSGGLGIGQLFNTASSDFANNTTITAVNGKTLTLSQAPLSTKSNQVAIITQRFKGDTNIGSAVIQNVEAAFITQFLSTGQTIAIGGVYPAVPLVIQSLGATSVTVDVPFGATTANVLFDAYFPATDQLVVGEELVDTNAGATLQSPTRIDAITGRLITLSAPATATQTNANFTTTNVFSVTLGLPTLRVTAKTLVVINVYRTEGDGTIFYLVSSVSSPTFNDPTVDYVPFFDSSADSEIIGNAQLYTTGGEVGNIEAPASKIIGTYKNRVILVPSENPLEWWYSKQVIPGIPVEFSDVFIENIDQRGGDITAQGQMDDKLIFFKEDNIFYVVGDGPTPAGTNNDFSPSQLITTDTGCIEERSVIGMPFGLMFKSKKGIYLLTRSLEAIYIGADVEAYNSANITSAVLLKDTNQVRFTLDTGIILVYDYFMKQWSTFTNMNGNDAALFQGRYTYLQPNGEVLQESVTNFRDRGEFVKMKLVTSWLSFSGLQGFQRVWKMLILGQYVTPHHLHVSVFKDFLPFPFQQDYIDAGGAFPINYYGDDPFYGDSTPYGGPSGAASFVYQWRVDLRQQKCQALKIVIEDIQEPGYDESMSLSGIAFEVGLKKGLNKLPAAVTYG